MPNHKSPKKRARADKTRHLRNVAEKSAVKTLCTKVLKASTKEEAAETLKSATALCQKAAKKGVLHKNTASRKISRLAKKVNQMGA